MDKVIHFEIPTDNLDRAKTFYQSLFGWPLMDIPMMSYTIVRTTPVDEHNRPKEPGGINGGIRKRHRPLGNPLKIKCPITSPSLKVETDFTTDVRPCAAAHRNRVCLSPEDNQPSLLN